MTKLLLIRHAVSQWNLEGRYVGQGDPPLSPRGWAQATALAERLAKEPLTAIYTSPLLRAWETAQTIASRHGLEVKSLPGLMEMDFGAWNGLSYADIQNKEPERLVRWLADPSTVSPPDGETLRQLGQRVLETIRTIVAEHPEGMVAIVGHGGPIRVFVCQALGLRPDDHWRIQQDFAAITRLDSDGTRQTLCLLNDACHLQGIEMTAPMPGASGTLL